MLSLQPENKLMLDTFKYESDVDCLLQVDG